MNESLIRNRVPHEYFVTSGVGESDITVHAGSYHLALREAGIEMCNIIRYSSIMPGGAKRVDYPGRDFFVHGEVLEVITAEATCEYGETVTAGLIHGWLHDPVTDERYGGLVCEYNGGYQEDLAKAHLREMLGELHSNGYEHLVLKDISAVTRTVTPLKMYGTAIVGICFISHKVSPA